ncbi:MAG: pyridoxamine 5'-phosphate oxidase [Deltaproteobacteria bacterium]|nr:pyridoxamine 5'-phosphate oxidase [Deltaproteobacteria bacterium]
MDAKEDPIARFVRELERARATERFDASRCALATATREAVPSVRFVLLKGVDARGFVFFTNLRSQKARELADNPHAALAFHWESTGVQIRVAGETELLEDARADAYFDSRPLDSRLGAWASKQSQKLTSRAALVARVAQVAARFAGRRVERPPFWGGYLLVPRRIEFWHDGVARLHDRFAFEREARGWSVSRLYP